MKLWRRILWLYSFLFNLGFLLVALVMLAVILLSRPSTVNFYLLPWEGRPLLYGLAVLIVAGAVILTLAWRGQARLAFQVWSLIVAALIARFFFFSPYYYVPGETGVWWSVGLVAAAIIAWIGSRTGERAEDF